MSKPFTDVVLAMVRDDMPDLSLRQCAVLVAAVRCAPADRQHQTTVRHLAEQLEVSKPAITRAFDRLTELDLGTRRPDPGDKRSVFFVPSNRGMKLARDVMGIGA